MVRCFPPTLEFSQSSNTKLYSDPTLQGTLQSTVNKNEHFFLFWGSFCWISHSNLSLPLFILELEIKELKSLKNVIFTTLLPPNCFWSLNLLFSWIIASKKVHLKIKDTFRNSFFVIHIQIFCFYWYWLLHEVLWKETLLHKFRTRQENFLHLSGRY